MKIGCTKDNLQNVSRFQATSSMNSLAVWLESCILVVFTNYYRIQGGSSLNISAMGIIEKGINGPFKGKAGSVIGSSWKKINYIKGLPNKRKSAPTDKQARQQLRFNLLRDFLNPLSKVLKVSLLPLMTKSTGVNAAFRLNFDHVFMEEGEDISLDYSAMQLSHGSLCTAGAEKAWVENDSVVVTWHTKTYGMGGDMDDIVYALVYCPEINQFFGGEVGKTRQDGKTIVDRIDVRYTSQLHTWIFFVDKLRKRASPTVYIPLSPNTP